MVVGVLDLLIRLQLMERIDFLHGSLVAFFALCFLIVVVNIERIIGKVFYKTHRSGGRRKK